MRGWIDRGAATGLVAVLLSSLLVGLGAVPPASAGTGQPCEPSSADQRVLVRWEAPAGGQAFRAQGLTGRDDVAGRTSVLHFADAASAGRAVASLRASGRVVHVERDQPIQGAADPARDQQWALRNTGQTMQGAAEPGIAGIDSRILDAWATTRGSSGVVVAVLDSGIDGTHPDLLGQVWRNAGETLNGIDDDHNGFVDDTTGWDFYNDDRTTFDGPSIDEHGTQVAGVIAAVADNGEGISGVAPRVRVMSLKMLNRTPDGLGEDGCLSSALFAIAYAADHGADLINASWGGPEYSDVLRDVIRDVGLLLVTASGNGFQNMDSGTRFYPGAYDLPNIVNVTAVDNRGRIPDFANVGRTTVDLGAPGVDVLTTTADDWYGYATGTSFAAPVVSGIAALVASVAPGLDGTTLADLLRGGARPLSSLSNVTVTGGIADAVRTLDLLVGDPPSIENACPPGEVPDAGFTDVPSDSTHAVTIDCVVWWDVARGLSATSYGPGRGVNRGQLATFLAAVVDAAGERPASPPDAFVDDDGSIHEPNIDALAALGIVKGTGPGTYSPGVTVSRAQMATYLVRTYEVLTGASVQAARDYFTDDEGNVHEVRIDQARELGVASGISLTRYGPSRSVRRDQMASFLARLLDVLTVEGHVAPPS